MEGGEPEPPVVGRKENWEAKGGGSFLPPLGFAQCSPNSKPPVGIVPTGG